MQEMCQAYLLHLNFYLVYMTLEGQLSLELQIQGNFYGFSAHLYSKDVLFKFLYFFILLMHLLCVLGFIGIDQIEQTILVL